MNKPEPVDREDTYFNAILRPHRSMRRRGLFWTIVLFALCMLLVSFHFFLLGAWPIAGFAGLDVILLYLAFRRNWQDSHAVENILITGKSIEITHRSSKGLIKSMSFHPYWVRLETNREEDKGMTALLLTSHGQRIEVGAFLHACERESLARALGDALLNAKYGRAQVSGG